MRFCFSKSENISSSFRVNWSKSLIDVFLNKLSAHKIDLSADPTIQINQKIMAIPVYTHRCLILLHLNHPQFHNQGYGFGDTGKHSVILLTLVTLLAAAR